MTRTMRAQVKLVSELKAMTTAELRTEVRRIERLIQARRKMIDEIRRQIGRLSDGYREASEELKRRAS